MTRYQLRREHDNRRRLNSFDYCDDDEDDDENDSLCELSVSTSVALGMNTSVADDADSDSDVSTPDQDQHDDSVVTAPQREHCYRLPFDSECNCLDSDVSSIDQLDDHPYLERPRSAENERKDVERRLECMHSSIDTIFPSEVQNTIMRYLDLKSLKNLKLMNGIYRVHVTCEVKRRRLFAWTQSDLRRGFEARYQDYLSAQGEQDKKRKLQIASMYDDDHPEKYYTACRELNRSIKRRRKSDFMRPSLLMRQSKPILSRLPPVESIEISKKQKPSICKVVEEKKSAKKKERTSNKRQMKIDGIRSFTSNQFMEDYNRLERELCLNMSPSSPPRDPKAARSRAKASPCAQAVPFTSIVDSPPQASRKRSLKSEGLTSSTEPIGIEQEQVKSASVLSKKKNSGKKRIKFTKEEDDAIWDGVKVFGEGDWKSIKTYHANVLNRRDNVAIKDRWRNIQLALNRRKRY